MSIAESPALPAIETNERGCMMPTGRARHASGYPIAKVYGKVDTLHRHVFRVFFGQLAEGEIVRHTCDNPACCNPAHLVRGSHADNVADRVARDRSATGESNGRSKLTEEQVREVFLDRSESSTAAGLRLGVDSVVIRRIRGRQVWRRVTKDLPTPGREATP